MTAADTPPPVDHRAEAEKHLTYAIQVSGAEDNADELVHLQYALVHATLAAGTPVADQHAGEAATWLVDGDPAAAARYNELREAVRAYIAAPTDSDAPNNAGDWYDRLCELVR